LEMHRNKVYGHADWARHKSSWRHGRHLWTIFNSGVICALGPPVCLCTLLAVFVSVTNHAVEIKRLPSWFPLLEVATLPFTLTSPVLALLLVFRTNTSYQRFDEARKAWGSNVNRTRDLARQALTWIRTGADSNKLHALLCYIKAYSFCLKHHLTEGGGCQLRDELVGFLEPEEIESVMSAQNRPIYVLQVVSELINKCQLPNWERVTMDKNLTQFHDNVGACERIFKTPIPVAYTRLTSRVLMLWHIVLPFALWEDCKWLTIPVTFLSSAALFYIEEVGVLIEEPFWILALSSISAGIVTAVDGLAAAHKEALMLTWSGSLDPVPGKDHVVINFDRSRSDGIGVRKGEVNVVLSRMKSVC
jgi:putative membrane protein